MSITENGAKVAGDAPEPGAHAATHATGGGDAITPGSIGAATAAALATESTARGTGDATNATAIAAEATARGTGDATNATAIAAEATARGSADTALAASIASEATARAAADSALDAAKANAADVATEAASIRTDFAAGDATNATAIASEATARAAAVTAAIATAEAYTDAHTGGTPTLAHITGGLSVVNSSGHIGVSGIVRDAAEAPIPHAAVLVTFKNTGGGTYSALHEYGGTADFVFGLGTDNVMVQFNADGGGNVSFGVDFAVDAHTDVCLSILAPAATGGPYRASVS